MRQSLKGPDKRLRSSQALFRSLQKIRPLFQGRERRRRTCRACREAGSTEQKAVPHPGTCIMAFVPSCTVKNDRSSGSVQKRRWTGSEKSAPPMDVLPASMARSFMRSSSDVRAAENFSPAAAFLENRRRARLISFLKRREPEAPFFFNVAGLIAAALP